MDLYTLQFRWIPSLIDAVVKRSLPCQALADVPWREKCLKEQGMTKADFSFEEIKAEVKKISEEKGRICLTFPYPKRAPLAKYAVIDLLASWRINYYTLEMSLDDTWVLGSQDVHRHSYIRQVPDCQTMADFEREVDRPCDVDRPCQVRACAGSQMEVDRPYDVDRPYERPTPERARVVWRCV